MYDPLLSFIVLFHLTIIMFHNFYTLLLSQVTSLSQSLKKPYKQLDSAFKSNHLMNSTTVYGYYNPSIWLVRKCDLAPMFQIGFMIIDGTLHYYGYRVIYHCKRLAIGRANGISKVRNKIWNLLRLYRFFMFSGFKKFNRKTFYWNLKLVKLLP